MIKYNLACECGNSFESWFASSSEFDSLLKKKMIKCISDRVHPRPGKSKNIIHGDI